MQKANPKSTVAPKVHHLNFGMIHCLFRYSTDTVFFKLIFGFNLLLLRLLGEISCSLLCLHSSWRSALCLYLPLRVGHLRASVPCPDRKSSKRRWLGGSGSLRPVGGRGTECGMSLGCQRPVWRFTILWHAVCSSREVVPGSRDTGNGRLHRGRNGRLHRLLAGEVWIVTCACTQDSWWLQQQP